MGRAFAAIDADIYVIADGDGTCETSPGTASVVLLGCGGPGVPYPFDPKGLT